MEPIVEIPNDVRERVYQPYLGSMVRFTPEFFTQFSEQIRLLRPDFTPDYEEYIIRFQPGTGNEGIGIQSLLPNRLPYIFIALLNPDNDNLREDVTLALQATFDALRAQAGGKRRKSRKARKTRKSRKAKKTRGRK